MKIQTRFDLPTHDHRGVVSQVRVRPVLRFFHLHPTAFLGSRPTALCSGTGDFLPPGQTEKRSMLVAMTSQPIATSIDRFSTPLCVHVHAVPGALPLTRPHLRRSICHGLYCKPICCVRLTRSEVVRTTRRELRATQSLGVLHAAASAPAGRLPGPALQAATADARRTVQLTGWCKFIRETRTLWGASRSSVGSLARRR